MDALILADEDRGDVLEDGDGAVGADVDGVVEVGDAPAAGVEGRSQQACNSEQDVETQLAANRCADQWLFVIKSVARDRFTSRAGGKQIPRRCAPRSDK